MALMDGRVSERDRSSDKTIYIMQNIASPEFVKVGESIELDRRERQGMTWAPLGLRTLAVFRDYSDKPWHEKWDRYRVRENGEWFNLAPIWEWVSKSQTFREMNGTILKQPLKGVETCVGWHIRVGTKEAQHNLEEYARMRKHADALAHSKKSRSTKSVGGRVFWELVSGVSGRVESPSLNAAYKFSAPLLVHAGVDVGHPMTVIHVENTPYRFWIFAEACKRAGRPPPLGAIVTNIIPRSLRVIRPERRRS